MLKHVKSLELGKSVVCELSTQEIAQNFVFLRPLVQHFPDHVPGGVLLTDIWLYLDSLFDQKLLCKPDVPKQTQAANEASRCKRLIGALRYLYRNSAQSHNQKVSELKGMLMPSPARRDARLDLRRANANENLGEVLADAPMDLDADADSEGSDEVEEDEPMPLDGQRSEGGEAVDDATTLVLGAGEDVAPLSDVDSDSDEASSDEAASDPDSPPNEPSGSNGDKGPGDVVAPGCFETPPVRRQLNMDAALSEEKKAEPDQPVHEIDSDTTSSSATVACRRTVSFAIVWVGFMANWGVVVYEKWETEGACRGGADATADLLGSLSLRGHENPNHEACNFSNLETMKLPLLGKPQWIKDSEHGMLIRSPPTVGEQVPEYNGYNLEHLPRQAWPAVDRKHQGLHSYTVLRGAAKIEILLRNKAYYVRGPNKGQISWAKHGGPHDAWIVACTKAGVIP
ncbi:unnamed protein product [Durusdinium trenchii]|uniref:Uncharacterized protein n=1 Tax=Durusdinium trenchii TaxID=1381693 RepID=A0ABP0H904_9DINO